MLSLLLCVFCARCTNMSEFASINVRPRGKTLLQKRLHGKQSGKQAKRSQQGRTIYKTSAWLRILFNWRIFKILICVIFKFFIFHLTFEIKRVKWEEELFLLKLWKEKSYFFCFFVLLYTSLLFQQEIKWGEELRLLTSCLNTLHKCVFIYLSRKS